MEVVLNKLNNVVSAIEKSFNVVSKSPIVNGRFANEFDSKRVIIEIDYEGIVFPLGVIALSFTDREGNVRTIVDLGAPVGNPDESLSLNSYSVEAISSNSQIAPELVKDMITYYIDVITKSCRGGVKELELIFKKLESNE